MSAADLLKMIEAVSPDDAATMDEIDKRSWCFAKNCPYEPNRFAWSGREENKQWEYELYPREPRSPSERVFKFTRSRDALKAIRPKGWGVWGINEIVNGRGWSCAVYVPPLADGNPFSPQHILSSGGTPETLLPTEELAELHAIIQAIEHERSRAHVS